MIGHLGVDRTYKALKLRGHNWKGMREDLKSYITECIICQKIKWQRPADWEDLVDHHLYSVTPLQELSIDTLGPLPEDEFGMRYIILIVDNFLKFVGVPSEENFDVGVCKSLPILRWNFRRPKDPQKRWRMSILIKYLLKYQHLIIVPNHSQGNSMAERRMKEVGAHLRAIISKSE